MKVSLCHIKIMALALCITSFSCGRQENNELEHKHESEPAKEVHEHKDGEIILEPEQASRFGIESTVVELTANALSVRVTGQVLNSPTDDVLVSATTSGVITFNNSLELGSKVKSGQLMAKIMAKTATGDNPNTAANAAILSTKRELDRLKPLLDDGIATLSEYNTALAAYEAARASYSKASSSGSVVAPIAGTVVEILATSGQYVDTGTPLARISRNTRMILRADLPESDAVHASAFNNAAVKSASSPDWINLSGLNGKRIDKANMPVKAGYIPIYFSFENNGAFSSGSFVEVDLSYGAAVNGIFLPYEALIEQQGSYYVFVKTGDHSYEKRVVSVGGRTGNEVEITSGLSAGDNVVTRGATVVKMAEISGNVPEGHSHTH